MVFRAHQSFLVVFVAITNCVELVQAQVECNCDSQCPDGWVYFENSCYLFGDDDPKFTWSEAIHHCNVYHSSLVVIDNAREDAFLSSFAKRLTKDGRTTFWLGATDEIIEGLWKWYTDDSNLVYTNWDPGQPDSHNGANEDCLYFYSDSSGWHDLRCDSKQHALCELSLNTGSITVIG